MKCMEYDPSEQESPKEILNLPPLDDKWFESIKWTKSCMECKDENGGQCKNRSCAEGVYDPWGDAFPLTLWYPGGHDVDKYLKKKAAAKGIPPTKVEPPKPKPKPKPKDNLFITKDDWKLEPLPDSYYDFTMDFFVSEEMASLLKFGYKPSCMEEKWFLYYDAGNLYFYRSWSGLCYYIVTLQPNSNQQKVRAFSYKDSISKDFQEFATDILTTLMPMLARENISKLKYLKKTQPHLFDTHAHVVFGVDDGATDLEMSVAMIRNAFKQGITDIVCTSHSWGDTKAYSGHLYEVERKLRELCIPVILHHGTEIACAKELLPQVIEDIQKQKVHTMLSSNYVMVEFAIDAPADEVIHCVKQITIQTNTKVILSHTERYKHLAGNMKAIKLLQFMGCLFQVNAYSLAETDNHEVKLFANWLLKHKLISFIGSDMHQTNHRPPKVKKGIDFIYQHCDKAYADAICFVNAEKLLIKR